MTQPPEPSPFIIIPILLGFAVIFPLFWMGVVGLISLVGGWSGLAKRFRCDTPPAGKKRTSTSGRVGIANYNFTLAITVAEEGVYLSVQPLFRAFHPPLLIPWSEVRNLKSLEKGFMSMFGFKSCFDAGSTRVALSLPVEELQPPTRA